MKIKIYTFFLLFFSCLASADEGMWMMNQLNKHIMDQMKEKGLEITAGKIYHEDSACIMDAVMIFNGGCTAELISPDGLIITNHHCGYDAIQYHSTVKNDYLKDGFWAKKREEELPTPDLSVKFLISFKDVTDSVLSMVSDTLNEEVREEKINQAISEIEEKAENDDPFYLAEVNPFYYDNRYYLSIYKEYKDVRFVGSPPSSIGKFGGDTDNWMWPRHTGDFSMFRIYTNEKGDPSDYDEKNIPLKSPYFLPISLQGFEKDDFTLILGFPGSTYRYMTSNGIKQLIEITNDSRIKIRGVRQEILKDDMNKSDEIRIKYAAKYSKSSNYWKYSIGQNERLEHLNIRDKKKLLEQEFLSWIDKDENRKKKYGEALEIIQRSLENRESFYKAYQYNSECFKRSCEILDLAADARDLNSSLKKEQIDQESINEEIEKLKEKARDFYKDYNASTDHKVTQAMFEFYNNSIDEEYFPDIYNLIQTKYKGNITKFVNKMFSSSIFVDSTSLFKFLKKPDSRIIEKDLAYIASKSIQSHSINLVLKIQDYNITRDKGRRLFLEGLMEMNKEKDFYPDANFTMRMTYGRVSDYSPRDAVHYNYYTTLSGVIEKEDTGNLEFIVPQRIKELHEAGEYAPYGQDHELIVNFTTNNDITGGNSGSPVLNKKGELIGLAFDGNWEAMSGDVAYESNLQKCINVDIRYILFIIEKFAGAGHLIEEMKIIR
ncbi:S46 family peptidase [Bacteroidota bacterium]